MKKDTYYFSHDFNAHNDVKILFLRQQLGMEGYGIYWFLIESLADAGGFLPLKIVPVLAMQMHTSEIKVQTIIQNFDLFIIEDESFFSNRLISHLNKRKEISISNSEKGKLSAEKRKTTTVQQQLNNGSTTDEQKKRKERKVKENKVKEITTPKSGSFYKYIDFNELPEQYIRSVIEQMKIQKQKDIEKNVVVSMWEIFKTQNLTGDKFYNNTNEVYRHFTNWIKNQKFESNGKPANEKRFEAYLQYANKYQNESDGKTDFTM